MERRQMLKYLLAGGLSAGITAPLQAQQGQPRPVNPQSQPRGTGPSGQAPVVVEVETQLDPAVEKELARVLLDWEQKTAHITKLRGWHHRYEYDSVFQIEKRSMGAFWYESPDKGRIDFNVKDNPKLDVPEPKKGPAPDYKPYTVVAGEPEIWVCDGESVLSIHITDKTYDQLVIPPHQRGSNIADGPLPFLFGVKAEKLKERYSLTLGRMHAPQATSGRPQYHVVAKPLNQDDARNWKQAEVLLDAEYCIPTAIRLLDPSGNKETVYRFPLNEMHPNEKLPWLNNPFKIRLNGFKLLQQATREIDQRQSSQNVLPVNRNK